MINVKNITKSFKNGTIALNNINLNINDGQIFGIIGTNGSGKSTLLNIISGIIKPNKGEVLVDNENIFDNSIKKQDIIYISDDQFYFKNSNLNNIKNFYKDFYNNFSTDKFDELIKLFNLNPNININSFSKGMKKQASIIIAIAANVKYILLDEIFDGLDPYVKDKVKKEFIKEIEEKNVTLIISSHNLEEIEMICDNIAIFNNNKLIISDFVNNIKENLHKYQIVIKNTNINELKENLNMLNILSISKIGNVYTIIFDNDIKDIENNLKNINCILSEELEITLKEIFIAQMEEIHEK